MTSIYETTIIVKPDLANDQLKSLNTSIDQFFSDNNVSIGYLRYHFLKHIKKTENSLEISIFIQDNLNNKTFGSYTLNFFNLLFNDQQIIAEISKTNLSSLKFFKKNNFSFESKNNKIKLF